MTSVLGRSPIDVSGALSSSARVAALCLSVSRPRPSTQGQRVASEAARRKTMGRDGDVAPRRHETAAPSSCSMVSFSNLDPTFA